jgi:catechol-2,3-dioxygenase
MPTITGTSHIGLTVSNLDRSIDFYSRTLGLAQLFRGRSESGRFEVAYLAEPASGTLLGLTQHDEGAAQPFNPRTTGLDHVSFSVATREDLTAWVSRLGELGIENSGITDQPPFGAGLNFADPDGIALEFYFMLPLANA